MKENIPFDDLWLWWKSWILGIVRFSVFDVWLIHGRNKIYNLISQPYFLENHFLLNRRYGSYIQCMAVPIGRGESTVFPPFQLFNIPSVWRAPSPPRWYMFLVSSNTFFYSIPIFVKGNLSNSADVLILYLCEHKHLEIYPYEYILNWLAAL